MNISGTEVEYVMENFLNESTNQPTLILKESHLEFEKKKLPIDMMFNSGHVLSISVYTIRFLLSAGGK